VESARSGMERLVRQAAEPQSAQPQSADAVPAQPQSADVEAVAADPQPAPDIRTDAAADTWMEAAATGMETAATDAGMETAATTTRMEAAAPAADMRAAATAATATTAAKRSLGGKWDRNRHRRRQQECANSFSARHRYLPGVIFERDAALGESAWAQAHAPVGSVAHRRSFNIVRKFAESMANRRGAAVTNDNANKRQCKQTTTQKRHRPVPSNRPVR
jgi:hypothetical protein